MRWTVHLAWSSRTALPGKQPRGMLGEAKSSLHWPRKPCSLSVQTITTLALTSLATVRADTTARRRLPKPPYLCKEKKREKKDGIFFEFWKK